MPESFRNFLQIRSGNLADFDHVVPPVMDEHVFVWNALEHDLPLRPRYRLMRAEGWHNIDLYTARRQLTVINSCNQTGLRMKACEVRRDDQNPM